MTGRHLECIGSADAQELRSWRLETSPKRYPLVTLLSTIVWRGHMRMTKSFFKLSSDYR